MLKLNTLTSTQSAGDVDCVPVRSSSELKIDCVTRFTPFFYGRSFVPKQDARDNKNLIISSIILPSQNPCDAGGLPVELFRRSQKCSPVMNCAFLLSFLLCLVL